MPPNWILESQKLLGNEAFCQLLRLASDDSKVTPNVTIGNYIRILNSDSGKRGSLHRSLSFILFRLAL